MADINEYLDGLNMKFSDQEKQLLDIFAECWEYCHTHGCRECEYRQGNEYMKMMLCSAYQYAKRLIAADVAPVKHGEWKGYTHSRFCGLDKDDNPILRDGVLYYCSECSRRSIIKTSFCPDCGAKMDGDADA